MTTTGKAAAALAAAALLASPILAQRAGGERLLPGCRAEIAALCEGRAREDLRGCLRAKRAELSAPCQAELRAVAVALLERRRGMTEAPRDPATPPSTTLAYGPDSLQALDLWVPQGAKAAPLVLFVHGGGWQRGSKDNSTARALPAHLLAQGYAFASIDYRLVPRHSVEEQAGDVAAALAYLLGRAEALGIDRSRVVLMGHSAGAHLAALVGTDERYLRGAGLSFADLKGVIPNDGAAYDVPEQMVSGPAIMAPTYRQAFGSDPARQRALSPTLQGAAPNAPAFLLLHVQRPDAVRQAEALAEALRRAGTEVEVGSVPGTGLRGHLEINRRLGEPDYPATATIDAWLRKVFG